MEEEKKGCGRKTTQQVKADKEPESARWLQNREIVLKSMSEPQNKKLIQECILSYRRSMIITQVYRGSFSSTFLSLSATITQLSG